ncbi:hypothetical protein GCM10010992_02730 [Cloacibacterium rupense]|uniref:Uncharacterized protein n=1 Tax=Cloacibacterium rupense TaxID=517423 RepID=A0ABQ2NGD8_9FLAO|nr:hypothetical protein [Cloacibacterium rupense]GGP01620.1 hypothetical protein GCM10010992_02730 [Cloacibacterium rupense]
MENFNENIDQLFSDESKKAEENATFPSFEKVWEKVENRLDEVENTTKKRFIPIWLPYSIAASLVFTFGIMYFFNQKETISNHSKIASNETYKVINNQGFNNNLDSANIAKLDQSIKQNIEKSQLNETSNNNLVKKKVSSPQVLAATKISNQDSESSNINTEVDKSIEISNNNDNQFILAKAAPSPVVENTASLESERIIETKKYKSAEVAKMSLNNQKTSELLTSTAEQSSFSEYAVNNDDDFKISRKHASEPLYIVDGYVADTNFLKNYNKKKITSLNIVEGDNAKKLYGNLAKKGVVVITTKGLNSQEEEYLKKNSKNYNLSGTSN